jgi:hypothetical protein
MAARPKVGPRAHDASRAVVLAVALLIVAAPPSSEGKPKPQACPDQRYAISGGLFGQPDVTIVVQGRRVSIEPICSPIRGRVKATRQGTKVVVHWKTCGAERRLRLRGRIDTACEQLVGTITARRRGRLSFVASRVVPVPTTLPGPPTTVPTTPTTTPSTAPAAPTPTSSTAPVATTTTSSTTAIPSTTVALTTTTTTLAGNVACDEASLRQAVATGGTIVLDCDATTIGVAGPPMIVPLGVAVSITTRGAAAVVLDGSSSLTRLFTVDGTLELDNLVIENFSTEGDLGEDGIAGSDGVDGGSGQPGPAGEPGGNGDPGGAGGLDVAPVGAGAGQVGRGGAILIDSGGLVRLTRTVLRGNEVFGGDGGDGGECNGPPSGIDCGDGGFAGDGGDGGDGEPAGAGGHGGDGGSGGIGSAGGPGGSGDGGAIYNAGTLEIADCTFESNQADGGLGGFASFGGDGDDGGFGGNGGTGDTTGGAGGAGGRGGDAGSGGPGGGGGAGRGGAIHNAAGASVTITRTVFMANTASGGDGGDGGDGGSFCGNGGDGGAPGDPSGTALGGNGGDGGNGANGGAAGDGGDAFGGAIYNAGTLSADASVVFSGNQVVGGRNAPDDPSCATGEGPCPGVSTGDGCFGGIEGAGGTPGVDGGDGVDGLPGTPATTSGPDVGP